jgi:hypothetical protein
MAVELADNDKYEIKEIIGRPPWTDAFDGPRR